MSLKSILISFLVHITITVLVLFSFDILKQEPQQIVEIEFKEASLTVKKTGQASARKSKDLRGAGIKGYKSAWNKLDTSQFFPSMSSSELVEKVEQNTAWAKSIGGKKQSSEFNNLAAVAEGSQDIFGSGDNKNWSYYQEIYKRIDNNLIFDSLLAQYGHFGYVYVQFKVTEEGLFVMEDLKTEAADAILKVHVLRTIRKSLSEPMSKTKYAKESKQTLFKARFDFNLGSRDNNFSDKQRAFGQPVFQFNRTTEERPVPQELVGHLMSGGISYDPFVMAERWKKYNKKKYLDAVQFDPFESYKRDAFYEM